jgi:hypothetical protein
MARRPHCPRCGGPVIRDPDRPPPQLPTGTCVNCGLWFALSPEDIQTPARTGLLRGIGNAAGVLGFGLLVGAAIALLARYGVLGGVLLIAAGTGLVLGVAALQAGLLDGVIAGLRERGRRLHPPK